MLTRREKGLNLFWLVALGIPAASAVYSCVLNAESRTDYVLGWFPARSYSARCSISSPDIIT